MTKRTVFEELTRFMSDSERNDLLRKIRNNLYADEPEDEASSEDVQEEQDERRMEMVHQDMKRISLLMRFLVWFRSKLSGKKPGDVFIAIRIRQLKKRINSIHPGLTRFEARDLSPRIAERVFDLYSVLVDIRPLYVRIWKNADGFRRLFMTLLEARIPDAAESLDDLVPAGKLEDMYRAMQEKSALREEVDRLLNEYVDSIPDSVFREAEDCVLPLSLTKGIVLFPFLSFFQRFHFTPLEGETPERTYFKSASAMLCLGDLERLVQALKEADRLSGTERLSEDVLMYLSVLQAEIAEEEEREFISEQIEDTENDDRAESVEVNRRIGATIESVIEMCHQLLRDMPLELLVRYFRKDPYYEIAAHSPQFDLKDLYVSVLKLRLHAELEQRFPSIRDTVLRDEIRELFKGKRRVTFHNYRDYKSINYDKLGLPFFRHTRSVTLLFDYINTYYDSYFLDVVRLLEQNVLSQNRITRDRLLQHSAAVLDTMERIREFDHSLSPDSDDGKLFQRLRFTLMQDPSAQRMFRTLVLQKDREVISIIDRGVEALTGMRRVLDEILNAKIDNLQGALDSHYFVGGSPVGLRNLLRNRREHLDKFLNLVNQVIRSERG